MNIKEINIYINDFLIERFPSELIYTMQESYNLTPLTYNNNNNIDKNKIIFINLDSYKDLEKNNKVEKK